MPLPAPSASSEASNESQAAHSLMNTFRTHGRDLLLSIALAVLACGMGRLTPAAAQELQLVVVAGKISILRQGADRWVDTQSTNRLSAGDRIRTGPNSRATLLMPGESVTPIGALTELEILPGRKEDEHWGVQLIKGILSFFHRGKPGRLQVLSRGGVAGIEGTEFVMEVGVGSDPDQTAIYVIDGRVSLSNAQATIQLTNLQSAFSSPGKPPVPGRGFTVNHLLQWCFYYPAVLDLQELPLSAAELAALQESLSAYRQGNLVRALQSYPAGREPASEAERVYHAALLLSVGQVEPAERILASVSERDSQERCARLAAALRRLIAAVRRESLPETSQPQLATELLAASYYAQSLGPRPTALPDALSLARRAIAQSPDFSFAGARVSELEFGFGHPDAARVALDRSLAQSPLNAEALALRGFLLAARNRIQPARQQFDTAIAADAALGNAWLGRGLCRIRQGDLAGGRDDLTIAAAIEPQRALLRSYLGKALDEAHDPARARHELQLAQQLDAADPTAWLYGALLKEQYNQFNDAVRDLESSRAKNDNRGVYRSQLLLEQDLAVRSANLARLYDEAGLGEVALREAAHATALDYGNYSAHLFLANSYDQLRSSHELNLRYETPAISEFLVANLLSPTRSGVISPAISQQEYSRLFERDRLGLLTSAGWNSRGAWSVYGSQYGTMDGIGYALEGQRQYDPGQRDNNDLAESFLSATVKLDLSPQDQLLLQAYRFTLKAGDLNQYYDQGSLNPGFRVDTSLEPTFLAGWHREWSPGQHTLALFVSSPATTRWQDDRNSSINVPVDSIATGAIIGPLLPQYFNQSYRQDVHLYSFELQQVLGNERRTTLLGARVQWGDAAARNSLANPRPFAGDFFTSPADALGQEASANIGRQTVYAYHTEKLFPGFQLTAGFSYDRVTAPLNQGLSPLTQGDQTTARLSPKLALVYAFTTNTYLRAAYTRSLGSGDFGQSYQLEPAQLAGFLQSFRTLAPDSVIAPAGVSRFETAGVALETKLFDTLYAGVGAEILNSKAARLIGAYQDDGTAVTSWLNQDIDFTERAAFITLNALVGSGWSFGARYRISRAVLDTALPDVPPGLAAGSGAILHPRGTLHELNLSALYNHDSGLFAGGRASFVQQFNGGDQSILADDHFWQVDLLAGYRSPRRHWEISLNLLNLTGQNYHLAPINLHTDTSRRRELAVQVTVSY